MNQTSFKFKRHGGKRSGAGRKRVVDEGAHAARPELNGKKPLHITIRLRDGLPGLRNRQAMKSLQTAMKATQNFGLRIIHFSILKNHLHLIAEVGCTEDLKRGMMSFNGRLGRWLRRQQKSPKGYPRGLFKGRYHVRIIETARQMKNTLKYVLLNASRHFHKCPYIDSYSSGACFNNWRELLAERFHGLIEAQFLSLRSNSGEKDMALLPGLSPPSTWLARRAWLQT